MKSSTRIRGEIITSNGKYFTKEDKIDMEIHDAVDYIVIKYITKGGKFASIPIKVLTQLSREEERIKEDKTL